MGQRHQAFLIARVRPIQGPPRYRCVGGFHHQWCYGSLPIRAMQRFLKLLERKDNAAIVRGELHDLEGRFDTSASLPPMPCPYTVSLLGMAWTTDLEGAHPYYTGVTLQQAVLYANMSCWDGDNDDGLTIIDITCPSRPQYCFLTHGGHTPLSAYDYLSSYYKIQRRESSSDSESQFSNGVEENIEADIEWTRGHFWNVMTLAGIPLISAQTLRETWPRESFVDRNAKIINIPIPARYGRGPMALFYVLLRFCRVQDGLDIDSDAHLSFHPECELRVAALLRMMDRSPGFPATEVRSFYWELMNSSRMFDIAFQDKPMGLPSTLGTSLAALVECCISGHVEKSSSLESILTEFGRNVKDLLRVKSPFPEHGIPLLAQLLRQDSDHYVDLSGFDLTSSQIMRVISCLPKTEALNISYAPRIVASDVAEILDHMPTLLRLIVMGCESLNGDQLFQVIRDRPWSFRKVEGIAHPSLLSIDKPSNFPITFTLIYVDRQHVNGVALAFFTPTLILQALTKILPLAWLDRDRGPSHFNERVGFYSMSFTAPMVSYVALTTGELPQGEDWYSRPVSSVPLQPHAVVSDDPRGSWAFYLEWRPDLPESRRRWGFVRYAPAPAGNGSTVSKDGSRRRGDVYDLYGFLRWMADEGRPAPDEGLVRRVEELLYARYAPDGMMLCPLMDQEDVPWITTQIPTHGDIYDSNRLIIHNPDFDL